MIPCWSALRVEAGRVWRFSIVGALGTATHVVVAFVLVALVALDPIVASIGGFLCSFAISFTGHKRISFRAPGRYRDYLGRFSVAVAISFVASTGIVALLTRVYYIDAGITFLVVGITIPIMNYIFGRFWVFFGKPTKPPKDGMPKVKEPWA